MGLVERMRSMEVALERTSDYTPSFGARVVRKVLAQSLRIAGIPRVDAIVTATVHRAKLRLRKSHGLPATIRSNPFYDTALPAFVAMLRERSASIVRVLDVGANIGDTAAIVAAAVGPKNVSFICVEADPLNIPLLRENVEGLSATIVEALAGATTSTERVSFVRDHGTAYANVGEGASVPVLRLDDITGTEPIHVIKIDTDGFEYQVLQGLSETIARHSPHLFIEVSPTHWRLVGKHDPMAAIKFLLELGYKECMIYDYVGYPMSVGRLDAPHIESMINYGSAKPCTYFDFLLSKETEIISSFYQSELLRIGRSRTLF